MGNVERIMVGQIEVLALRDGGMRVPSEFFPDFDPDRAMRAALQAGIPYDGGDVDTPVNAYVAGTIRMDGADVTRAPMHKRIQGGLRRTYQHAHLFDGLTVRETLFLAVCGVAGGWQRYLPLTRDDEAVVKAEALAGLAGLEAKLDDEVSNLSHGQRRQLEIGMELAETPKLLLLDEPAAGLSPRERPRLAELLLSLPKNVTVVLIEHDMDIALKTSDSVSVLHNGRLLAEGSPENIMSNEAVHNVYM